MEIQNNQLHLGGLSVEALRINFGSPLYVYEEDSLRSQCRRLLNCFEDLHQQQRLQLHFAMKANSNPSILKILREEGAWIDAVSPYEVQLALDCGYRPEQILFTGNNTAPEELDFCVENGVPLNIGSLLTLEHFGKRYSGQHISLRANPGVGAGHHAHCITGGPRSKFGIYHDQLEQAQELAHSLPPVLWPFAHGASKQGVRFWKGWLRRSWVLRMNHKLPLALTTLYGRSVLKSRKAWLRIPGEI